MVNPEWLRTFECLAERKNFSVTAKVLGMTQPGVSQHLRKLEEALGSQLVKRDKKTFELLPSAMRLLSFVAEQRALEMKLLEELNDDNPQRGRCAFAGPGSISLFLYDEFLKLGPRYRDLRFDLEVAPSWTTENLVREEKVDVGFVHHAVESTIFHSRLWTSQEVFLCVPKNCKLRKFDMDSLKELKLVWHPDCVQMGERLLSMNIADFSGMGDFPICTSINQLNRILDPVAAGLGFTLNTGPAIDRSAQRKNIRKVRLPHRLVDSVFRIQLKRRQLPARYKLVESYLEKNIQNY